MLRRILLVSLFGLNGGISLMIVASTVPTWFAHQKVNLQVIGCLSLLQQPYVFKFLWAPYVDTLFPSLKDPKQIWILSCLIVMTIAIIVMSMMNLKSSIWSIIMLLIVVSLSSATHDVAADGKRIELLLARERGIGATFTVMGFRVGMLIAGAFSLIVADVMGWAAAFKMLACMLLISTGLIVCLSDKPSHRQQPNPKGVWRALKQCLTKPTFWPAVMLILAYKCGAMFTTATSPMMGAFFLDQLHFSLSTIGLITKGVGVTATLIGGLCGGVILIRYSVFRCLLSFAILQLFVNGLFLLVLFFPRNHYFLTVVIFSENFIAGLSGTSLVAYMMSWCDSTYAATQFAILASISALPQMFAGPIAGWIVTYFGWLCLFTVGMLAALPAIVSVCCFNTLLSND